MTSPVAQMSSHVPSGAIRKRTERRLFPLVDDPEEDVGGGEEAASVAETAALSPPLPLAPSSRATAAAKTTPLGSAVTATTSANPESSRTNGWSAASKR